MFTFSSVANSEQVSLLETTRKFTGMEKSVKLLANFQDSEFEVPSDGGKKNNKPAS